VPATDLRRSRVEATATGPTGTSGDRWSFRCGPGATVDLNQLVAPGLRVRDVMDEAWFDPIEPAASVE